MFSYQAQPLVTAAIWPSFHYICSFVRRLVSCAVSHYGCHSLATGRVVCRNWNHSGGWIVGL